ncbi:hypothetical protein LTR17_010634 [Elasticomyces elasticus]|nr:hypothetical protein LTR17_010634 [Elasticomyces elasticus]
MASSTSDDGRSPQTDLVARGANAQNAGQNTTPEQSNTNAHSTLGPIDRQRDGSTPTSTFSNQSNGEDDGVPSSHEAQLHPSMARTLPSGQARGVRPDPSKKPQSLRGRTLTPRQTIGLKSVETTGASPSPRGVSARFVKGISVDRATQDLSQTRLTPPAVCSQCVLLKLTFESFVVGDTAPNPLLMRPSFQGRRAMGTYSEIKARAGVTNCELCQLLVKSMDNRPAASSEALQSDSSAKCALFWRVDGMETVPREDLGLPRTFKRTRRLAIEWVADGTAYETSYIVLVAPEENFMPNGTVNPQNERYGNAQRSTFLLGRKLTSLDVANTTLVKRWLDLCRAYHPDCRIDRTSPSFRETQACFTVLDVRRMMLSALPEDAEYLALSYTWGPPDTMSATRRFIVTDSNVCEMERENSVGAVFHRLPVAIQNAITLTRYLGFDYICTYPSSVVLTSRAVSQGIDSLCVVQGNAASWNANARLMDVIYGFAELTICAADGDGASAGLQALYLSEEGPGADQQIIVGYPTYESGQDCLELMLSWPPEAYIACSSWNTRAWTFQERMLSPKCLICVNKRVYFQCKTSTMSEDIHSDVATHKGSVWWSIEQEYEGDSALAPKRPAMDPVSTYKECVRGYTCRQLTDESDILSAFEGIGKLIYEALTLLDKEDVVGSTLLFGLPASHFDFALLWQPAEGAMRRNLGSAFFPSWSWSGWRCEKGMAYFPAAVAAPEENLHEWLMKHTWITYYVRDSSGHLRLIWDPTCEMPAFEDHWRGYETPSPGFPSSSNPMPSVDFHGRPWECKLPMRGRMHERGFIFGQRDRQFDHRLHTFRGMPRILAPGMRKTQGRDMPYLQFYTWWGRFYVDMDGQDDPLANTYNSSPGSLGTALKRYSILDYHGDCVGVIVLDGKWGRHRFTDAPQEFIAISRARAFDEVESRGRDFYAGEGGGGVWSWQLYNVLMIVRDDPNKRPHEDNTVAYRAGLGKMYIQAFEDACPDAEGNVPLASQWKEILLG